MADIVSQEKRSEIMAGIRAKDTVPEIKIRKALHARGFRYRLHEKKLPGKPDLVFGKYRAVIFVHGCFWHGHDCHLFKWPSSRQEFWTEKISKNKKNDRRAQVLLEASGWRVLHVWECAIKGKTRLDFDALINSIENWIFSGSNNMEIKGK